MNRSQPPGGSNNGGKPAGAASRGSQSVAKAASKAAAKPALNDDESLPLFSSWLQRGATPSEGVSQSGGAGVGEGNASLVRSLEAAPASASGLASLAEKKVLTVSALTAQIKGVLEPAFRAVWVQGEISNCKMAPSGHVYFSLKDTESTISAAIFGWGARQRQGKAAFELRDGMQVLCRGKVTVFGPRGSYQLTVDEVEPLGAGALQVAFEQLKAKLNAEGLFAPARKRKLPAFPRRVAIVTSPTGAAIRDMLSILKRRAPQVRVMVVPALVQGATAPAELIRGLELANRHRLGDVIVLARGGGSIEDLWAFNDEGLARAISRSELPVISAVGHQIDFTIGDFVADVRAATPSAAAEILSENWVGVPEFLKQVRERLRLAMRRDLDGRRRLLEQVRARVISPRDRLREQAQRCDDLRLRLDRAMGVHLERRKAVLQQWMGKLDALSPLRVLERGYALVRRDEPGRAVVRSAAQPLAGEKLKVTFHDGERTVQVLDGPSG